MLALVALLVVIGPAEPPADAPTDGREQASARFATGSRAFDAGDYEQALREFRAAFALVPSDEVRFNIAVCLEELGRFREAVEEYRLAADSEQLGEVDRERARVAGRAASSRLGRIVVEGAPNGARVFIDAEPRCTLPCEAEVDPGTRVVRVAREGDDFEVEVELGEGTTQAVKLPGPKPADATLPPAPESKPARIRPGPMTWIGVATVAVGTAGIVGFGLSARSLHDDYEADPSVETRDRGLLMRNLANASIGIAALGGALIVADLIWFGVRRSRNRSSATRARLVRPFPPTVAF